MASGEECDLAGGRVMLQGLVGASELNGREGVVEGEYSQCWVLASGCLLLAAQNWHLSE